MTVRLMHCAPQALQQELKSSQEEMKKGQVKRASWAEHFASTTLTGIPITYLAVCRGRLRS